LRWYTNTRFSRLGARNTHPPGGGVAFGSSLGFRRSNERVTHSFPHEVSAAAGGSGPTAGPLAFATPSAAFVTFPSPFVIGAKTSADSTG